MNISDLTKWQSARLVSALSTICEENAEICRLCPFYLEEGMTVRTKDKGSAIFDCVKILLKEVLTNER